MVNVRVRGIYSTAVSKLLLEEGFKLVEASDKIIERLNIPIDTSPCDATVKDTENPDEILVLGFPVEAKRVFDVLVEKLNYVYKWESKIELHSVYLGVVVEKTSDSCIVDLGGEKGYLYPCREDVGAKILVGVKHAPLRKNERLVLTRNFRLVGKRIALVHGEPRITFSEHIYDPSVKAKLSAIATSKLMGSGIGIHFRSSAKYADRDELSREIDLLLEEYKQILQKQREQDSPVKLRHGEFIGIIGLTSIAKRKLDEYRRTTCFTIDYHHSLKSMGYSDLVDFAEEVMSPLHPSRGENTEIGVLNYIARRLRETSRIELIHVKPTGEVLRLQHGRLYRVEYNRDKLLIVLERVMKSEGIYDGLGVDKKPGDIDYMVVETGSPIITHNYYRSRVWLGTYININTPPEITPSIIKYHDLLVDVVVHPSGEVKIVDEEELVELYREGVITKELYEYAVNTVKQILLNPMNYVFNPGKNLE